MRIGELAAVCASPGRPERRWDYAAKRPARSRRSHKLDHDRCCALLRVQCTAAASHESFGGPWYSREAPGRRGSVIWVGGGDEK